MTIKRAQTLSKRIDAWRRLRAEVSASEKRCASLQREIARRETGPVQPVEPYRMFNHNRPSDKLHPKLADVRRRQVDVNSRIAHARQVLVREAIAVFGLDDHEIARLPLPSPDTFRGECAMITHRWTHGLSLTLRRAFLHDDQCRSPTYHSSPFSSHILSHCSLAVHT